MGRYAAGTEKKPPHQVAEGQHGFHRRWVRASLYFYFIWGRGLLPQRPPSGRILNCRVLLRPGKLGQGNEQVRQRQSNTYSLARLHRHHRYLKPQRRRRHTRGAFLTTANGVPFPMANGQRIYQPTLLCPPKIQGEWPDSSFCGYA